MPESRQWEAQVGREGKGAEAKGVIEQVTPLWASGLSALADGCKEASDLSPPKSEGAGVLIPWH